MTNTDGTPLTDLAGYKIYYGTTSGTYTTSIDVGNVTNYTLTGLTPGLTYYIAVTAYDKARDESGYSNEGNSEEAHLYHCDFNKDSKADIVWRNKSTGESYVWFMSGNTLHSGTWLPEVTDTLWEIVGMGDFRGDGKTDIVWRHKTTGQNAIWFMAGATLCDTYSHGPTSTARL
jgi:hypothetical protein